MTAARRGGLAFLPVAIGPATRRQVAVAPLSQLLKQPVEQGTIPVGRSPRVVPDAPAAGPLQFSSREAPQLGNVVEVRINRPDPPFVFQRDRSDHQISLRKDMASRSQSASELRGTAPIVPR